MGKKRKQDPGREDSSSSDAKRCRSCHCHNGETSRPNDGTPPREGSSDIFMQIQLRTEEKFKRKIQKLKEKRKKDKIKHEEDLRVLKEDLIRIFKEDHEVLKSKIQEMQKEASTEVNHYKASPSQRSQLCQPTRFRLKIENCVKKIIYRKGIVETKDGGDHIKVVMYDGDNRIASDHPLASVRVELVVIKGGFNESKPTPVSWSKEEFEKNIVQPPEGIKRLVENGTFDLIDGSGAHEGAIIMDNSKQREFKIGVMIAVPTKIRVLEGVSNPFKVQEGKTRKPAPKKMGKKPSPPVSTQNLVQPTSSHATQHGQGHFLFSKRVSPDEQHGLPPPLIQRVLQKTDHGRHSGFLTDGTAEDNRLSYPLATMPLVQGNGQALNGNCQQSSQQIPTPTLWQPTSNHSTQHDEGCSLPPPSMPNPLQVADRGKHSGFPADVTAEDNGLSYPPATMPPVQGNGQALNGNSQQSSHQFPTPMLWQPTSNHSMQHGEGCSLPPPSMPNPLPVAVPGYYPALPAFGQDHCTSLPNASSQLEFRNFPAYMPFNDIPQGNSILGWEEFVEDVSHSNVRPPVEEHYVDASFRCNQVLLQWDEPHMEVKKRWNFLDQLMPLYSTQSGFYKEDFPSTSLMDKTHKLLASISPDDSVWKIITSVTSRATQTPQRRGVLIRPIEPYDSDDGPPIKKQRTKYQLRFVNTVCNDYFTRENIKSEDGNLLKVALYDENNLVVTSGPLSAASVEIVLLHGDFNAEGQDYWTSEEFSDCLVHPQSVKEPPALGGDRVLTLIDGEADLGNVYFRTSSFHARTEKFKMGVEIKNVREESVQEGITGPFFVRVRQGEESIGQWITSLEASLRVSKQVPPLECDARKYVDALAVKVSTEEKFKTKIGKLKVKREKDKNKYEEDLRILMEDHKEFTLKTEDMRKEGRAELNHYILSPSQRSQVIQSTRFRLVIENSVSRTIYKNSTVKTEDGGDHIKVVMYDGGKPIAFDHPLASVTVDLVLIEGGFDEKRDSWSKEEFEESIIEPRKGIKRLVKNGTFDLIDGRCDHHGAIIMDNSQRMEVKLGVRIAVHTDTRVIEGVSNPFKMKEVRTEVHGKSTIPYKDDAVHRLKKIALKGKYCKNLEDKYITKVKHLLRHYHKDKFGLQKLVDMKKEDWNTMINHATMCVPGDEIYSYWVQEDNCEILFNDFYDLVGKITDDYVPYSVNDVDQFPQLKVNNWKKSAYKKFDERENSGVFGLTPDYFMNNGRPVRAVPLNNDAGPTVQASTWQYPNDRAAQQGLNRSAVCQYTDARSPASENTNQNNVIPPTTTADGRPPNSEIA